jgi:Family of unknown function (DUF6869)
MTEEDEQLLSTFLLHRPGTTDGPGFAAVEDLDELVRVEPLHALAIVRELIGRSPSAAFRSYVAAGPLEDLVRYHGETVLTFIEQSYPGDALFEDALSEVWIGDECEPHIHEHLEKLAKQHGA